MVIASSLLVFVVNLSLLYNFESLVYSNSWCWCRLRMSTGPSSTSAELSVRLRCRRLASWRVHSTWLPITLGSFSASATPSPRFQASLALPSSVGFFSTLRTRGTSSLGCRSAATCLEPSFGICTLRERDSSNCRVSSSLWLFFFFFFLKGYY